VTNYVLLCFTVTKAQAIRCTLPTQSTQVWLCYQTFHFVHCHKITKSQATRCTLHCLHKVHKFGFVARRFILFHCHEITGDQMYTAYTKYTSLALLPDGSFCFTVIKPQDEITGDQMYTALPAQSTQVWLCYQTFHFVHCHKITKSQAIRCTLPTQSTQVWLCYQTFHFVHCHKITKSQAIRCTLPTQSTS